MFFVYLINNSVSDIQVWAAVERTTSFLFQSSFAVVGREREREKEREESRNPRTVICAHNLSTTDCKISFLRRKNAAAVPGRQHA